MFIGNDGEILYLFYVKNKWIKTLYLQEKCSKKMQVFFLTSSIRLHIYMPPHI